MKTALVYRSAKLYELVMLILYGRHYYTRYRVLADLVPPNSSLLDLCCGPGVLYQRYLRKKGVTYTGLDISEHFIKRINAMGNHGLVWDLREDKPLPTADYVLMQASLYQFLPDAERVTERMLKAAEKRVIIAEPIRNLSSDKDSLISRLAKRFTNPGTDQPQMRFTEQTLDSFFSRYSAYNVTSFLMPGGREKVYILNLGD